MEKKFSQLITILFHPLIIPTYAFLILLNQKFYFARILPYETKWTLIILIFLTTFVIPAFMTLVMKRIGTIRSYTMENREERTLPYMITVLFFYLAYYLMRRAGISSLLQFFMAGATLLVIITLIINIFWKISGHMVAIGGVTGALIALSFMMFIDLTWWVIAAFMVSGMVAYARLRLNAHTPSQIYAGFLIGVFGLGGFIMIF